MAIEARLPITVGGLPGTGTTTACQKLARIAGLEHHYVGQIFRDMADERNKTLEAFGRMAEADEAIDRELDDRQLDLLRRGPVILEGRLSGWLAHREGIPAYKVWFHASAYVRAERVAKREGGDPEDRMAEMRVREASERKRYQQYYGLDLNDLSPYDLVVDTTERTPLEIVEEIHAGYSGNPPKRRWYQFWK